MSSRNNPARVAIVMGSKSDWATMQFAAEIFEILDVPHHVEVVSAHRTPDKLFSFAETAEENGYRDYCRRGRRGAPAGNDCGKTLVPVLGVPVQSAALSGVDSLYSIVQMPRGIPVGTLAIGKAGAANAALLAAQILAQHDAELHQRIADWRKAQTDEVLENPDPRGRYEASLRSRQRATGPNAAPGGRTAGYRRLAGWSGCRAYRRAGTAERHYRRD